MKTSKISIIFCLCFAFIIGNAQNCLEYEEFEGGPCNCWPNGWDGITGAEEICEIVDFDGVPPCSSNVEGESPSGGNVVGLHVFPGITEGITQTWTGLTPSSEYIFVIWWLSVEWQCGGTTTSCCADLSIIVDGEEFVYDAVDDWTLVELCIEAMSTSIDITVQGIANNTSGYIILDDADCADAEQECCGLFLELPDDDTVCPNTPIEIIGSYTGANGPVNFEWTSEPADGINYLDDTNIENPIFEYLTSDNNFPGATYTFTLTGEDDICDSHKEIEIEVLAYSNLSFEFETMPICSETEEFILPSSSLEGIQGSWDVNSFFPVDHPGELLSFFFTPDEGELECPNTSEHFVEVQEYIVPTFDFPLEYCRAAQDIIELPETSLEGIEGFWNYSEIEVSLFTDGLIDLIFSPFEGFCTEMPFIEIEIYSGEEVEFDLPLEYCSENNTISFPTVSLNGTAGFWSYDEIDLSSNTGVQTNIFTADFNGFDCYTEYEYVFEIIDEIIPNFNLETLLCSTDDPLYLDNTSIEGYQGSWSTPIINPSKTDGSIGSTWSPSSGQSACLIETHYTFNIAEAIVPEFDIPLFLCESDDTFTFPLVSNNDIDGTWTSLFVDPSSTNNSSFVSTFIPNENFCAEEFTVNIEIFESLNPEFNLPTEICKLDPPFLLPTNSINGLSGVWNVNEIDPAIAVGASLSATFTPDNECQNTYEYVVSIINPITPNFNIPNYFCEHSEDYMLPPISLDNISGNWDPETINIDDNLGSNVQIEFTPEDSGCFEKVSFEIFINKDEDLNFEIIDPSNCQNPDGEIEISGDTNDLEYSIDNESNWQSSPIFSNLAAGSYTIIVRPILYPLCISEFQVSLNSIDAPLLENIMVNNIDNCEINNGSILIIAEGENLEYSIDDGLTWQNDPLFSDLNNGIYQIGIREIGSFDCTIEGMVEVQAFPETIIDFISATNVTDCESSDGSIFISGSGQNLEYSIDAGLTWTSNNIFNNLPFGEYEIQVRSSEAENCFAEEMVTLEAPESVTLIHVDPIHTNDCEPAIGNISIEAIGSNLEYSIDNGNNWQTEPSFSNLMAGDFIVMVRNSESIGCHDQIEVTIIQLGSNLEMPTFIVQHVSECNLADGSIEINSLELDIEYSIDGGLSWASSNIFNNLSAGEYQVLIRKTNAHDCLGETYVQIQDAECPCNDLQIIYEIEEGSCFNDGLASIDVLSVLGMAEEDYEILWSDGSSDHLIMDLLAGWQSFEILYDDNCVWLDSIYIDEYLTLSVNLNVTDESCPNANDGIIDFSVEGGQEPYDIIINGENILNQGLINDLSPGQYSLVVQDANDCLISIETSILEGQELQHSFPSLISTQFGELIEINPGIELSDDDSYEWLENPLIQNPDSLIIKVLAIESSEFVLTISQEACLFTLSVFVEISDLSIYVPNVFSPNADGSNDIFYPQSFVGSEYQINNMSIFDRWGNLVFQNSNFGLNQSQQGWDGSFNGELVNPGVYTYMIEYLVEKEKKQLIGTVSIIY